MDDKHLGVQSSACPGIITMNDLEVILLLKNRTFEYRKIPNISPPEHFSPHKYKPRALRLHRVRKEFSEI